jgi:glycine cleavage system regulatory protein
MQFPLIMTVVGRDRPGLVESIARLVSKHGGNWSESRMCRLGGDFAGILQIHIDQAHEQALRHDLQSLQLEGLNVALHASLSSPESTQGRTASLELVGQDRPGIVREISHALARQGVNVEELETECCSAPMSGEMLFKARARLQIPPSCPLPELRKELEHIGGNLLVDVSLQALS